MRPQEQSSRPSSISSRLVQSQMTKPSLWQSNSTMCWPQPSRCNSETFSWQHQQWLNFKPWKETIGHSLKTSLNSSKNASKIQYVTLSRTFISNLVRGSVFIVCFVYSFSRWLECVTRSGSPPFSPDSRQGRQSPSLCTCSLLLLPRGRPVSWKKTSLRWTTWQFVTSFSQLS